MNKIIFCEFNLDSACVELCFTDGTILSIDTIAVENAVEANLRQQAELDYLIYNKPLEYADLVLNGGIEAYINSSYEH